MRIATIPEQLGGVSYCPTCGARVSQVSSYDPFAICFMCPSEHRFFVMPEPTYSMGTPKATSVSFPDLKGQTPQQVASFWLSDATARGFLNEQLAMLLRVILEGSARVDALRFLYCPVCGDSLIRDGGDAWVDGYRCARGHRWGERGGRLGCPIGPGSPFGLCAEPTRSVVEFLISAWLRGGRELDAQLDSSVREVFASSVFHRRDA
jgi:hypothetical protein